MMSGSTSSSDTELSSPYHRQSDDGKNNNNGYSQVPAKRKIRRQVTNMSMPHEKSDLFGATCNMLNTVIGPAIIAVPYAFANAGYGVGLALLLIVSYLTDKSVRMIVEMATFHPKLRKIGVLTYEDLARIPFGRVGAGLVMATMVVVAFGDMIANLIIIKDTIPIVFGISSHPETGEGDFVESELVMTITSILVVLPLSMMRDMASLEKASMLSVMASVILVFIVVGYAPVKGTSTIHGGLVQVLKDNWFQPRIFIALGVLSSSMCCHHGAFFVSNSLHDITPQRWSMVSFNSVAFAAFLSICIGFFGYFGFLGETQGDIFNNFGADTMMANLGRFLMAVSMFLTYPMESFVTRHVIVVLFFNGDLDGTHVDANGDVVENPRLFGLLNRRHQITLAIYIATLIPSIFVDDLGPVVSLTGALGASFIAYICCGLVYLGINGEHFLEYCQSMLEVQGHKSNKDPKPSEFELPLVGDATAIMVKASGANAASATPEDTSDTIHNGWKPLWWYLGLFPLWTRIASWGAAGTREFLHNLHEGDVCDDEVSANGHVVYPCKRDYYVSMFMILFGIMAAVVGLASNIMLAVDTWNENAEAVAHENSSE